MTEPSGGVTVWGDSTGQTPFELRFLRASTPPPTEPEAVEREWSRLCAGNPRLFSGPISSVEAFDAESRTLTWRPSTYRSLAVQPRVETGTWHLSVTALLLARGSTGLRVFMGRRGRDVHTYPGLWEFGPSGGIDPPGSGVLDLAHIRAELAREVREEIGLEVADAPMRTVGLFRDPLVRSYDVVLSVGTQADVPADADGDWEYAQRRWIPTADLDRFVAEQGQAICPPSRALAAFFRWPVMA